MDFAGLVSTEWPLIGYLYADDEYRAQYDANVREVVNGVFNPSSMQATYTDYAALIAPYATAEIEGYSFLNNSAEFESAVNELKSHVTQRADIVNSYLE